MSRNPAAAQAQPKAAIPGGGRAFTVSLNGMRRGRAATVITTDPPATAAPVERPCRAALSLALAHELQRLVDSGEVRDRATLAEYLGFTRARITQLLDLLLLAPDIQEDVLLRNGAISGNEITERHLRACAGLLDWTAQRRRWRVMGTWATSRSS